MRHTLMESRISLGRMKKKNWDFQSEKLKKKKSIENNIPTTPAGIVRLEHAPNDNKHIIVVVIVVAAHNPHTKEIECPYFNVS